MKAFNYSFLGTDYKLGFFYDHYTFNGNLYVGLVNLDSEEAPYFADLTINIMILLPFAAVINDQLDSNICNWLESIGAGRTCDRSIRSGYAEYPLFQFDEVFLKDANPESFAGLLTE